MSKITKKCLIISALFLLINTQPTLCDEPNNDSFWYTLLFGWGNNNTPQQPRQSDEEAPEGVTIEDYINQLRYDLNGAFYHNRKPVIPWNEVDEIANAARVELRKTNLLTNTLQPTKKNRYNYDKHAY